MLCYVPYCVSGVPYFPVLVKCGLQEEQGGGIVDCIQTINMSGINELLVSQRQGLAGGLMSDRHHHRPESLLELEELLDFPPQMLNEVELDGRLQSLCKVIQNARDTFSSGLLWEESEEENQENNPFQELHIQVQKATDRFDCRLAAADGGKLVCGCRRLFKRTSQSSSNKPHDFNPYQELRDALRMARRHFIPLIDQYISSRNNNDNIHKNSNRQNSNNITLGLRGEERKGSGGYWNKPTTTSSGGDISHHAAANAGNWKSTIQRLGSVMEKDYHCPKPGPISIECNSKLISSQTTDTETGSVQMSRTNSAANCCARIFAVNSTDDYSESCLPLSLCNCNKMSSGGAVASSIRLVREAMDPPCHSSSFTGMATNSNELTLASRLRALTPVKLQRRKEGRDEGHQSMHPIMSNPASELDAANEYEQLSSTGKDLRGERTLVPAKSDEMSPLFRETEKYDGTLALLL